MQRICKFLIVILFFSIATGCVGVEIPDWRLESAIRKAIGKPDAPIHVIDLKKLTVFDAHGKLIADLTGLEYCTNLEELYLDYNTITDIKPLSQLVNLKELNLRSNVITDISPLSQLVNLEMLDLDTYGVTNILPLSKLVNLKVLHLWSNEIIDISPLSNLVNLEKLDLEGNKITDISPLIRNSGLSKGDIVHLADNPLSSESIDVYIPQLKKRGVKVWF